MTNDSVVAYCFDPSFTVAPDHITALFEEIIRAGGTVKGFDAEDLEKIVKDAAGSYRPMLWMKAQGHLGADTLDRLADPVPAVIDLLKDDVNQTRLIPQLLDEGFGDIPETYQALTTTMKMLAAIQRAAPRAHQGRTPGRPQVHPEINAAFRVAVRHFIRIFGEGDLRGRSGWSQKPPQPKHFSAVFLFGVLRLAAPDRLSLAEEVRNLMEKEIAARTPGPRPGRRDR